MIDLKMPKWLDSIRAIIALALVVAFCVGVYLGRVPIEKLAQLKELTLITLTFYFVVKKRKEGE